MADYTAEEIQASVERLVLSSIRRPFDTLGTRRVDLTFSDVQQAAAGVFILYPNAPFYVLKLGSSRLGDLIAGEAALIDQLLDALAATDRKVLPVNDVSPLFNAQAALQELGSAAVTRAGVFADITKAPAYQRFSSNVSSFLAGPGSSVKANGKIAQTPQQARAAIPGLVSQIRTAHGLLVAKVQSIANGVQNYNELNLPSVVVSSVLSNAAKMVGEDADALNSLTPAERLGQVRDVVLHLLTARRVVATFGSFAGPSDFFTLSGIGIPTSDALRLAEPAVLAADKPGAVSIIDGVNDTLTVTPDGGTPFSISLNPSLLAELDGSVGDENFLIGDGANPVLPIQATPNNNKLKVRVNGVVFTATLTLSAPDPRTADQVAADIQAVLPAGAHAEGFYAPLRFSGPLDIPAGVDSTWTVTAGATDLVALGVKPGDSVNVLSGANAGIWPITAVTTTTITVVGTTVAQPAANSEIGPANRRLRLRLDSSGLALEKALGVFSDDPVSDAGLQTLGFFNGIVASCKQTTPDLVAGDINGKTTAVVAGSRVNKLLDGVGARTDVLDATQVTFTQGQVRGTQSFVGLTLTFVVSSVVTPCSVRTGRVLVLRDGPDVLRQYLVTTINGATVTTPTALAVGDVVVATGAFTGSSSSDVLAEFGPAGLGTSKYDAVVIEGGPNGGTYFVQDEGPSAIDVLLQQSLPLTKQGLEPIAMTASFGEMVLTLASKDKTTASSVSVNGSAAALFFVSPPGVANGFTPWFRLPSTPRGLQPGDLLETYASDYSVADSVYEILGVDVNTGILQISPSIPSNVSWTFTPQPVPFARLRVGTMNDYTIVKERLETWLLEPVNQATFFTDFNRLVNPLLVSENPTAVQVGSATNELEELYSFLLATQAVEAGQSEEQALDNILASFSVESVPAIDDLIRSYTEKGSDRAVDLLLEGQFSVFFGLGVESSSYAAAFQSAVRDVAMSDLPVRRFNRSENQGSQLLSQSLSPDFEYNQSDITETVVPDIPADFGEPSNFGQK